VAAWRRGVATAAGTVLLVSCVVGCPKPAEPPPVSARVEELAILPAGTVRYIVGGDSRNDLAHVLPWAFHEAKSRKATAFLFLGDMEITPGLDAHFEQELALLDPVRFYPCLGNHEVKIFGFAPENRDHAEKSFRDRFLGTARTPVTSSLPGKVVYSVDLPGGVHFIALDNVSQKGFGRDQLAWLESDLEHARANPAVKYIVPGMHKPLAKNGFTPHAMDDDGAGAVADSDAALAMFVKYKVALIVASHLHQFGEFRQEGIPSYITGGLGAPLTGKDPAHAFHHFMQLDVKGSGISVSVVRFDGKASFESEPEVE
jgi:hypothetical protein